MSPRDLRIELEREFSLVCFEDLATVRSQHGAIFRLFRDLKQEQYAPNQRLVFYTGHAVEQRFIDHIQRAAIEIDISNFFILLVTPHDLEPMLESANQRFGADSVTMGSLIRPVTRGRVWPELAAADPRYLCPIPFAQLFTNANGDVNPCCKFKGLLGNIKNQDLEQFFHNQEFRDLRQQMMSGQQHKGCAVCWHTEHHGGTSLRQLAMQKYGKMLNLELLDRPQIRDLSWVPSTLCNFSCRTCSADLSTSIAAEEIKWSTDATHRDSIRHWIRASNDQDLQDHVIDQILTMKELRYLHVLGGEPLLWPKFPRLIQELIDHGLSSRITLEINTNVSVFPKALINDIIHNFAGFEVLLSIDDVGDRFELERGGTWLEILSNARAFAALESKNTKVKLVVTINIQNVLYLDAVADLAQSLGIEVLWWYLESPDFLCIDEITPAMQSKIVEKYQNHRIKELRHMAKRVAYNQTVSGQAFLDYVHRMDSRRGQTFAVSHLEVYEAMGGCIHQQKLLQSTIS